MDKAQERGLVLVNLSPCWRLDEPLQTKIHFRKRYSVAQYFVFSISRQELFKMATIGTSSPPESQFRQLTILLACKVGGAAGNSEPFGRHKSHKISKTSIICL